MNPTEKCFVSSPGKQSKGSLTLGPRAGGGDGCSGAAAARRAAFKRGGRALWSKASNLAPEILFHKLGCNSLAECTLMARRKRGSRPSAGGDNDCIFE